MPGEEIQSPGVTQRTSADQPQEETPASEPQTPQGEQDPHSEQSEDSAQEEETTDRGTKRAKEPQFRFYLDLKNENAIKSASFGHVLAAEITVKVRLRTRDEFYASAMISPVHYPEPRCTGD